MPSKHKKRHNKSATSKPSSSAPSPPKKDPEPTPTPTPIESSVAEVNVVSNHGLPVATPQSHSKISSEKATKMAPSSTTPPEGHTVAPVLVAVKALLKVIENYNGSTVNGLFSELKAAKGTYTDNLGDDVPTKSKLAVKSACEQFMQYATLTLSSIETEDLSRCREQMLSEGLKYLSRCERSIDKIARWAVTLIFDGARILVHSNSLVVLQTLRSVPKNIYFSVYIVIDDDSVSKFFEKDFNIDVKTIRDAEIGTLMEGMDLVMVGAEAVLKNGGIINKVGTLPLAICAREMNKPMYVLAESFKFSKMYPMSQSDLPKEIRENPITKRIRVDYTLPKYITFLVTDRGLLTPTAVCDELIELYT